MCQRGDTRQHLDTYGGDEDNTDLADLGPLLYVIVILALLGHTELGPEERLRRMVPE